MTTATSTNTTAVISQEEAKIYDADAYFLYATMAQKGIQSRRAFALDETQTAAEVKQIQSYIAI